MDDICFSDEFPNPKRLRFIEIEFCDIGRVEVHRLAASILFDDHRTVADLWHSSPDFPHGSEDPRLLAGRHARWRGEGAQLRHRLATAFDDDNAAVRSLSY